MHNHVTQPAPVGGFRAGFIVLFFALVMWGTSMPSQAQTGGVLCAFGGYEGEFVPMPDGYTGDIEVEGNVAFVLHYDGPSDTTLLLSIDYSNPAAPLVLDALDAGDVWSMYVAEQTLYLNIDDAQIIRRIDISDPSSLAELDPIQVQDEVRYFEVQGNRLFYFDGQSEVQFVDFSDPSNPVGIGQFSYGVGGVEDFTVVGDRFYATTSDDKLRVYDITNPDTPVPAALYSHEIIGSVQIERDLDVLMLRNTYRTFELFHLDPGGTEILRQWSGHVSDLTPDFGFPSVQSVELRNGVLTYGFDDLTVLSISIAELNSPRLIGFTSLPGEERIVVGHTDNGTVLATRGELGISRVTMADLEAAVPISDRWDAFSNIDFFDYFLDADMRIEDGTLYAPIQLDDFKGQERTIIAALDVTDPVNPVLRGIYEHGFPNYTEIEHQEVRDSIVFYAARDYGLDIVDFSNPMQPERVLLYKAFRDVLDMKLDGDTLWMQVDDFEHVLLDVSDIHDIRFKAYYSMRTNNPESAMFSDGLLYISHEDEINDEPVELLSVIDLSDPFRPVRVDYPAVDLFHEMSIHDGVLFGFNERDDIMYSSPVTDLQQFGSTPSFGKGRNVQVIDGYAYWVADYERLAVFDVSDPYNPRLEGILPRTYDYYNMAYGDGVMMLIGELSAYAVDLSTDCDTGCLADLTGDGALDFFDVTAFLQAYMDAEPSVDFNGDGSLDFYDVSLFLQAYGQGCP